MISFCTRATLDAKNKLSARLHCLLHGASTVCDAGAMQLTTDDIAIEDMVDE